MPVPPPQSERRLAFCQRLARVSLALVLLVPGLAFGQAAPGISQQPQSQTVLVPANATFSVTASGQTPLSYHWLYNGTNLSDSAHIGGSTNTLLTITNVSPADAGSYSVVVTNRKGSVTSAVATLTVHVPATLLGQPTSQAASLSTNVLLTASATGTAPLSFQWYLNGQPLASSSRIGFSMFFGGPGNITGSTLNIQGLQVSDAGNYQVVVSNAYNVVTSQTAALAISVGGSAVMRFVNLGNPQPQPPYTSWFTAATNLQDALDVTGAGDQIVVSNGVYGVGSRVVGGMNNRVAITLPVAVSSVNGPAWTVIDGGGALRCVSMADGSSLTGFTLTNGASSEHGGGVRCDTTNVVVSNCVFVANSAYIQGGGAYQGTLLRCTFTNNSAAGVAQGYPGGGAASSSVLKGCVLSGNFTRTYGMGGGLYACQADGCILSSNSAPQSLGGGACLSTLNNCLLVGNYAGSQGGGAESCTLNNCTVVGNTAYLGAGGGIDDSTANNCIIYSNALLEGTVFGIPPDQTNCAQSTVNYSCTTPLLTNGVGNISNPPGFVNQTAGDFHLQVTSPCLNAGNNTLAPATADLDGNPRVIGPTVDMGAFEYQAPTIAITSQPLSQTRVEGQNAILSVSAVSAYPLSYEWLFNGQPLSDGLHVSGSATVSLTISNVQPGDAGSYSVQVANSFGAVTSAVATLNVLVPPSFTQQPASQSVVVGTNAAFSAAAEGTDLHYQWFFNGNPLVDGTHWAGALTDTLHLLSVQSADAGSYYLLITNVVSSATSAVATLEVLGPPWFTQQPASQIVAVGTNVSLSATVTGTAPSYRWYFNGTALADSSHISGAFTSALNLSNVQHSDTGSYWLVASNAWGTLTSAVATVTVLVPPSFGQQPVSLAVGVGSNATFSAAALGSDLAYQWLFNGTPLLDGTHLSGALTSSLTLSNVQTADAGSYSLRLSNAVGTATSAAATLTVAFLPTVNGQPVGRSVPPGLPTIFSATATGTAPLAYQWQLNGSDIAGATNPTYSIFAVGASNLGAYHLVVSNAAGIAISTNALLTFGPVAAWGRNDALQCLPPPGLSNVIAVAGGATYSMALCADGTVVAWGISKGSALPAGLSNVVAIAAGSSDDGVALRSDGSVVSWNNTPLAPATLSNTVAIAAGFRYGLALNRAGTIVGWPPGGYPYTETPAAYVPGGLTRVSALAAGGSQSIALRTDGTVVAWGSGLATNVPSGLSNIVAVASGNSHGLALRADGTVAAWGTTTATNVPAGLTNVMAIAAGGYPQGNSQSLAVRSNGLVVAWGDNTAGQSSVPINLSNVVAIAGGAYHALALEGNGAPLLLRPPVGGTLYSGGDYTLIGLASGAAPLSYQWLCNGTNLPNATNSALTLAAVQPSNAGAYQLVVSNALGVVTSAAAPVMVVDSAPFFVQQPAQTNRAGVGVPFALGTAVAGSGPLQFQWSWNGQPLNAATSDTLTFNPVRRGSGGAYTLTVSNSFGAVTSTVATLWPASVVAWGGSASNPYGETNVPLNLSNAVAISAGFQNSLALCSDGTALGWGFSFGPGKVPGGFSNLVEVAVGTSYSLGLTTTGTVVSSANLGSWLTGLSNIVALEVDANGSTLLRADGTLARLTSGGSWTYPTAGTNVVALARAYSSYAALRADGTVFYNSLLTVTNVLGMGLANSSPYNELFLKQNGALQSLGPLVIPAGLSNGLDVAANNNGGAVLRTDGTAVSIGTAVAAGPPTPPTVSDMAVVDAGSFHFLGLLSEQPFPRVLLPAALNTTNYVVSSKSSPQWFGQTNVTHDGVAAAQSAPIERNTASSVRTLVQGPVTVSFWWKVSSQTNHHTLAFSAGGIVLSNISGEVDWQPCTVSVPAGYNMLQWTYAKDDSPGAGQDAAWVDQLVVTPVPPSIVTQPPSLNVLGGSNVVLLVNATGTPPLHYAWFKNGGTSVGANSSGLVLSNVTRTNSGTYSVIVTNVAGSVTSSNGVLVVHVPQLLGTPVYQAGSGLIFSAQDTDGGLLSSNDLPNIQVQFSTNLLDWITLPGALSLSNGLLQVQDPGATNAPARFYRMVESW